MSEMKLIMENWRGFLLYEQEEDPETVGQLLKGLNAYIFSKSDKLQRVAEHIANALEKAGDIGDEAILEIVEQIVNLFAEIAKSGLYETIKKMGKDFVFQTIKQLTQNAALRNYVLSKVGEEAISFVVKQVAPMAMSVWQAAKWIVKVFNISKDLKAAYEEGTADVNKVFQNIVKDIMTAPDNKETTAGFLGLFNIDDEWQKLLDDKVEIAFIEKMIAGLKAMDPNSNLTELNFNQKLIDHLKDSFQGRTLTR